MCVFGDGVEFSRIAIAGVHGVWVWISGNKGILVVQDYLSVTCAISRILEPVDSLMTNVYMRAHSTSGNTQRKNTEQRELSQK